MAPANAEPSTTVVTVIGDNDPGRPLWTTGTIDDVLEPMDDGTTDDTKTRRLLQLA